jgi:hypothetical protein
MISDIESRSYHRVRRRKCNAVGVAQSVGRSVVEADGGKPKDLLRDRENTSGNERV